MATSPVPPTPPRPPRANRVNPADPNPTAPTAPIDGLRKASFSPLPADRMGITSRSRGGSVTTKGKKGMLSFMAEFLNLHKRPEISTAYDPVHLTPVGFNSSTGKFTGLPMEWQEPVQDGGICESDPDKNRLDVVEIVKFYQGGGGDVWDKMGHAPVQASPSPPIPGAMHATDSGASASVNASGQESPNSIDADVVTISQLEATVASKGPVAERQILHSPTAPQQQSRAVAGLAKTTSVTPLQHEKTLETSLGDSEENRKFLFCVDRVLLAAPSPKKGDNANGADIVKRLQICTDAVQGLPRRLGLTLGTEQKGHVGAPVSHAFDTNTFVSFSFVLSSCLSLLSRFLSARHLVSESHFFLPSLPLNCFSFLLSPSILKTMVINT